MSYCISQLLLCALLHRIRFHSRYIFFSTVKVFVCFTPILLKTSVETEVLKNIFLIFEEYFPKIKIFITLWSFIQLFIKMSCGRDWYLHFLWLRGTMTFISSTLKKCTRAFSSKVIPSTHYILTHYTSMELGNRCYHFIFHLPSTV